MNMPRTILTVLACILVLWGTGCSCDDNGHGTDDAGDVEPEDLAETIDPVDEPDLTDPPVDPVPETELDAEEEDAVAPNGTCETALPLEDGDHMTIDVCDGPAGEIICEPGETLDHVLFYSVTVPAGEIVAFVEILSRAVPPLWMFDGCESPDLCLEEPEPPWGGPDPNGLTWWNTGTEPVELFFQLYGSDSACPNRYDEFEILVAPPAENRECDHAVAVSDGDVIAVDSALSPPVEWTDVCLEPDRPLFYRASVPAGERLYVSGSGSFAFLESCDLTSCLEPAGAGYWNRTSSTRDVVIAATHPTNRVVRYDLSVRQGPADDHAECGSAAPLDLDAETTMNTAFGAEGPVTLPCWPGIDLEGLHYFGVTIPAGRAAVFFNWSGLIGLLDGCAAATCLASNDTSTQTFAYRNETSTDQDLVLAAGRLIENPDWDNTIRTWLVGTGGTDCSDPVAIASEVDYAWHEIGPSSSSSPLCDATSAWGTVYFEVDVPAGRQLSASAGILYAEGEWLRVAILESCDASSCYGWREASGAFPEEGVTDHEQTVIVAVGAEGPVTDPLLFEYSFVFSE
jgi:hypothetical protein